LKKICAALHFNVEVEMSRSKCRGRNVEVEMSRSKCRGRNVEVEVEVEVEMSNGKMLNLSDPS
jgi:hypothetical protein